MDLLSTNFDKPEENKLSTELRLALKTPINIRKQSLDLNEGYEESNDTWSLIVRYNGNIQELSRRIGFNYVTLLGGFAIVRILSVDISKLIMSEEILYIEKPKRLYEEAILSRRDIQEACFRITPQPQMEMNDKILVAMIDSGIDIYHEQFIAKNGESKIICIWDQRMNSDSIMDGNIDVTTPEQYGFGALLYQEAINAILLDKKQELNSYIFDPTGHGTAVASILCDLIPQIELLVVSMVNDTLAFLCAVDFAVRFAQERKLPLVLNLSYGNNYGDHSGNSIVEAYLDTVSVMGKYTFVTGTGNEGNTGRHNKVNVLAKSVNQIEILVQSGVKAFNIQLWSKNIDYIIRVLPPSIDNQSDIIEIQYGSPTPYNTLKENYISISGGQKNMSNKDDTYIQSGIWSVVIDNKSNENFEIQLWLPVASSTSGEVYFLNPKTDTTMTVPATANNIISVGAFDAANQLVPAFSGKGFSADKRIIPDVVAPGVLLQVANAGGGEKVVSGTSFSVPFVSSAAYNLMNRGIVEGKDLFLYGQKVKAYIQNGAKEIPGYNSYPNYITGYGLLCSENSLNFV